MPRDPIVFDNFLIKNREAVPGIAARGCNVDEEPGIFLRARERINK